MHANALVLREMGLLLRGGSGAGKSALSMMLVAEARLKGEFACLVGDDRIALENRNGRLIARPHIANRGLIEVRGIGIVSVPFESGAVIRGLVDLSSSEGNGPGRPAELRREYEEICGLPVPKLVLEMRDGLDRVKISLFLQYLESR
ncbi:HPr kinase [Methylocystis bryophila]|nr:HPr kinase [Methylocystis bryophila]